MFKKKILLISHNFWPENFQINLISNQLSKKYDITVLTGKPNYPKGKIFSKYNPFIFDQEMYNNIKVFRVPIIPRGNGSTSAKIMNYLSFIFSSLLIIPFTILRERYDFIFVYAPSPVIHSLIGIFLKKIKKIPVILWLQDHLTVSIKSSGQIKNRYFMKFINFVLNYIYKNSDRILIQSKAYKKFLNSNKLKFKLVYVPNASAAYPDKKINVKKKSFNIFYAGNFGLVQEFDTIIKVAKILQDMKLNINLIFYGEGLVKKKLKKQIKDYKLSNFKIRDFMKQSRLVKKLYHADALFVSLKEFEGLNYTIPSKIQFYMGLGKPIIGEISGESAKIIKEAGSGFTSKPGNKKELLKNILKMYNLKKNNKLNQIGIKGYKYFSRNFSLETVVEKIEKCLKKI